jgi:hypothetical protein
MADIITKAALEARRAKFKPGSRVELVSMSDPYNTKLKPGDLGEVEFVDDIGSVFIKWDNGATLAAAYGADEIKPAPPSMTAEIREQILAIRDTGATNMFDVYTVQRLALDSGYYALVEYIEANRAAYGHFILTGEAL